MSDAAANQPPALTYHPVTERDGAALVDFLTAEDWPFHYHLRPPLALVREWIDGGHFLEPQSLHLWVLQGAQRIGLVGLLDLEDIDDGEPELGLRITAPARGRGVGTAAVRFLCAHAFDRWPQLERIFAKTRADNIAMRRVLVRCGFAKEMRARRAWHSDGGARFDSLGYGLLRADWERGVVTPVPWNDAP